MSELIGVRQRATKVLVATGLRGLSGGRGLPGDPGLDGRSITSVTVSLAGHLLINYSDGSQQDAGILPGGDTSTLELQIANLTARVEALESGAGPVVPPNAMADSSGQVLVDSSGNTLIYGGDTPVDPDLGLVLVSDSGNDLLDDQAQTLTAGE